MSAPSSEGDINGQAGHGVTELWVGAETLCP